MPRRSGVRIEESGAYALRERFNRVIYVVDLLIDFPITGIFDREKFVSIGLWLDYIWRRLVLH